MSLKSSGSLFSIVAPRREHDYALIWGTLHSAYERLSS
jgi:hypothetical protein